MIPLEINKIIDLENDGVNMAADGQFLYIRRRRDMCKYDPADMSLSAHNIIFKKDGKARSLSICDTYIFLTDFCDLYILRKDNLQVEEIRRLGVDLSSDLGCVRFDRHKAYISIRNGKMAVMDIYTRTAEKFTICDSSFWDHCVVGNRVYVGTVKGEFMEIDTGDMRVIRKTGLCKKNIYSVTHSDGIIYTVSQDTTIKAVDASSFEIVRTAKNAVRGMARILGKYKDELLVLDSGQISFWDAHSLQQRERFCFSAGSYGKGAVLHGNRLYGSDYQSVYSAELE
jgi:hypothetical protein